MSKPHIEAGRLTEYVSLQRATNTQDGTGAPTRTWSTFAFAWAQIDTLTERERLVAAQLVVDATHRVTLRYDDQLTPVDRVLWNTRVLDVSSVIDPGQQHEMLVLECQEKAL